MLDNISNNDFSYIVGFLQGDGNYYKQSRNRGKVTIELSIRDKNIITKMIDNLSEYKCYYSERKRNTNFKDCFESCKLSIYEKRFRDEIEKYIPEGNKSHIIEPPLKEDWFSSFDYLRGIYDADGSIGITGNNRPFISLCTDSKPLKQFVIRILNDNIGIVKRINRNKRDNIYNIVCYDEDAVNFADLLYNNSDMYLDRKFVSYKKIQSWVRTTPKRKGTKKTWLPIEDKIIMNNDYSLDEKVILLNRSKSSIKTRIWRNNSNKT